MGALVAMVPAKFGSNKREGEQAVGWGGGLCGGKTEEREKEKGVPKRYGNLKITPVNHKTRPVPIKIYSWKNIKTTSISN